MPNLNTPPTEDPGSFRFFMRGGELVIRRIFQAFGTRAQVFHWRGKNVALPARGMSLPLNAPLDPDQGTFVNQLEGMDVDLKDPLAREWRERLIADEITIQGHPSELSTHKVVVDYKTSALANPYAPVVRISVGSETLLRKWDWNGNLIAPGFEGGIPVERPLTHLTYTRSMRRFGDVFDEIEDRIGMTNNKPWDLYQKVREDRHQWEFLGADAHKGGELNWRVTFRFVRYPPITIQNWYFGLDSADEPITKPEKLPERGRYYYWYVEQADGSINRNPGNTDNKVPLSLFGLQRTEIRDSFDFNTFFTSEGIDPEAEK